MSKQILNLHEKGVSDELTHYMKNVEHINRVRECVNTTEYESNIYKVIASFEDAGIVTSTEVPVGSHKEKMNYILTQAISQLAPSVHKNMQLAGAAAKQWNEQVITDNQQERLNAATAKLKIPVKDASIPSYSEMNDGQRQRTQAIFQSVLKKEEPLSIDFVTEAIDRYNAGADKTVLFRTLGLTLEYGNALAVYEQDSYEALMNEQMFSYLLMRWESYQRMVKAIGEHKRLTPQSLSVIVDTARYAKVPQMDNNIRDSLKKVSFTKAVDEYNANSKPTTDYADVKPYLDGVNTIMPMSVNNRNRLRGLCTIVSNLKDMPVYEVVDSQTDMSSEDIYHSLSVYFEVMEEITQNLMAFLFLTQTTVRNNTLVEDVITAINMVDVTIDNLFNKVKDASGEDGNISQESFKNIIGKIMGTKPTKEVKQNTALNTYNAIVNIANEHNEVSDVLLRLKLRDNNSLDESRVTEFKTKHKDTIKNTFGVDIANMDVDGLFVFMTSGIFSKDINHDIIKSMTCDLYDTRNPSSKAIMSFLRNDEHVTRLFQVPFISTNYSFLDSTKVMLDDFSKLMYVTSEEMSPAEVKDVTSTVLEYFANEWVGSYHQTTDDFKDVLPIKDINTVSGTSFTSPITGRKHQLGYTNIDISSQHSLFNYFVPNKKTTLNLNQIKNNMDLFTLCKNEFGYNQFVVLINDFLKDETMGLPVIKGIHEICLSGKNALKTAISECTEYSRDDAKQYNIAVDAMLDDTSGAMFDIEARSNFAEVLHTTAAQTSKDLRQLYINFNEIAEDFIGIAR